MIETSAFLPNTQNIDNRFTIIFREKGQTYFNSYLIILTVSNDLNEGKSYPTLQWKLLIENNLAWNDK